MNISFDVKNTGKRAGEEVVQMYVKHLESAVARPLKELKGFKRVMIEPNQTTTVTLPLISENLAYWDVSKQAFVVEKGTIQIMVGSSSADTRLTKTIRVTQ